MSWIKGLAVFLLGASFGCSSAPPCPVTPIHIEETREDVKVLERDLNAARERASELQAKVDTKKKELDEKKDQPDRLRQRLEELKRGSGRGEDKGEDKDEEDEKE